MLTCMKGTPGFPMSLSRSPSPRAEGGWSSPGLTNFADDTDKVRQSNSSGNIVTWAGAKKKSELVNGGNLPFPRNNGFFNRHMRSLSNSLPRFNMGGNYSYAEKEKLGRGRWNAKDGSIISRVRNRVIQFARKSRLRFMIILGVVLFFILYMFTRRFQNLNFRSRLTLIAIQYWWRRAPWLGGGKKFVVILAANQGGGVMEWKGPREWAIERDSVKNKRKYVAKWGYDLEIVDMSTKKRYAHEWRESWEKVDTIRNCLRKYPSAQWYV